MISVIIPFWNAEAWIGRCAKSLQAAASDFEFILVNDKSEDKGEEIAKQYADERFVFLENEHTKGVSGARNTGLDHARGDWVTFLDADDELLPDAYATFCRMMTANITQANHLRHYEKNGRTVMKYTNRPGTYKMQDFPKMWCMVWNKLYRREFIGDTRFNEAMKYGEDELFNVFLLEKENKIRHFSEATILRHFDNRESLARTKTADDLILQAWALEHVIMRSQDPEIKKSICDLLSEHWGSKTYKTILGG